MPSSLEHLLTLTGFILHDCNYTSAVAHSPSKPCLVPQVKKVVKPQIHLPGQEIWDQELGHLCDPNYLFLMLLDDSGVISNITQLRTTLYYLMQHWGWISRVWLLKWAWDDSKFCEGKTTQAAGTVSSDFYGDVICNVNLHNRANHVNMAEQKKRSPYQPEEF